MKMNNCSIKILSLVFMMITFIAGYSQGDNGIKNKNKESINIIADSCHKVQTVYYTCPVHTKVRADKAGNCPQCGTTMNKRKDATYYYCPLHKEVEHATEGNCEKCGSGLEKKQIFVR